MYCMSIIAVAVALVQGALASPAPYAVLPGSDSFAGPQDRTYQPTRDQYPSFGTDGYGSGRTGGYGSDRTDGYGPGRTDGYGSGRIGGYGYPSDRPDSYPSGRFSNGYHGNGVDSTAGTPTDMYPPSFFHDVSPDLTGVPSLDYTGVGPDRSYLSPDGTDSSLGDRLTDSKAADGYPRQHGGMFAKSKKEAKDAKQ
ncbi:uncharacterized protein PGTG_12223 [Puccinia graminis f. sp. tritici CRL 75-36-700-3]|uniref:Uncharacterized protein n=1 Tax=Puccinia graminis f. sp. tritici (strain CRL 75-36-700-3 / race SCCL) TaxID=418459 RepID=E3KPN2_PUCGT|nr:uncharacterized protein PGTG_12223 [Puccinia graminis f. sp. tritici CRL 75-36-700-3]EFP86267.2 hypothetical protein PGTG_12223 [Puccinia graminis f. sp. tritici CRL 75-36-700-3]